MKIVKNSYKSILIIAAAAIAAFAVNHFLVSAVRIVGNSRQPVLNKTTGF